jgi:RimJ/RimL family protein N-acetyltransferase
VTALSPASPLTTARLTLRPPQLSDAAAISALLTDDICQYIAGWSWPLSVQDVHANLQSCRAEDAAGHCRSFVICDRQDSTPVGWLRLFLAPQATELAYWIGQDHQRRGYASEAARAAIRYAFDDLATPAVIAGLYPGNDASRHLLQKLGFTPLPCGSSLSTSREDCSGCDYLQLPHPAKRQRSARRTK